ncbi:MAG: 50S ribosomal protein L35 [Chloroflexi bacterium]|nr:50S ribosomal protein L35 [Chloroflexota bacterium]
MPKMKTHKATAKRFRLTGTGKIVHNIGGAGAGGHLRRNKAKRTKRMLDRTVALENKGEQERIMRLMPYLKKKG